VVAQAEGHCAQGIEAITVLVRAKYPSISEDKIAQVLRRYYPDFPFL
jgi:hypothetical protein